MGSANPIKAPREETLSGYLDPRYAHSYHPEYSLYHLIDTVYFLDRAVPGTSYHDLQGVYPFVVTVRPDRLVEAFSCLQNSTAVSAVFVSDPYNEEDIRALAGDLDYCRPFKTHYASDLATPWAHHVKKNARYETRLAQRSHVINIFQATAAYADRFWDFYQSLIARHNITGLQRLSLDIIRAQLRVSGATIIEASDEIGPCAASVWYECGERVYLHLHAQDERAYRARTSYALYAAAHEYFSQLGYRWLMLGAGAGVHDDPNDGLARYKRMWSTATFKSYVCGRILDFGAYETLAESRGSVAGPYFPIYRAP